MIRVRLKWKILALTVPPIVALTVLPMWIVNQTVSQKVNVNVREDLVRAGAVFEQILSERAEELSIMGQALARDPKFFSLLTVPEAERNKDYLSTVAGVSVDFNSTTRQDIFEVLGTSGNVLASGGPDPCAGSIPNGVLRRALSGVPCVLIAPRSGKPHLLAITPILVGGRLVGALVLGQHLGPSLAERLSALTRSDVSFLSTDAGVESTLPSTRDHDPLCSQLLKLVSAAAHGRNADRVEELRAPEHRYLALVRPFPHSESQAGLAYGLSRSLDEETEFLKNIQRNLVELGIVAYLVAFLAGLLIVSSLTSPLLKLVRGAEELEHGNYDFPLDIRSRDEIGYLAARFRDMRESLRRHMQGLRELARVKSEFLSVASHELRTPLTIIKGFHELLLAGTLGPVTEAQEDALRAIGRSADKLEKIAEDATRMAQIDQTTMELQLGSVHVPELLREVTDQCRAAAPDRSVELSWFAEPGLEPVRADRARLVAAVSHLVQNGVRYTPDGGRVDARARREGGTLVIEVRDTGIGIDKEKQREIFERPQAARDSLTHHSSSSLEFGSAGLGLGLSIASGIALAHGGTLSLESEPGKGSTFTMRIPISEAQWQEAA